jgi:hypothetical protein
MCIHLYKFLKKVSVKAQDLMPETGCGYSLLKEKL